mmetsp:Transcript_14940/g.28032  ORF Transcript_14940/g.28032 Transcript_14940/m.28032 type:complete len:260 (+) Transcript_14940:767-1546(+)
MNQSNFFGGSCQNQRVFHGRITTANHNNVATGKQVPVTSGTRRDSTATQFVFSGDTQPLAIGSRCDNDRVGFNGSCVICDHLKGPSRSIDGYYHVLFKYCSKLCCLTTHRSDDAWSRHIVQSRIVFNINAFALELSSHTRCDHQRSQTSSSSINCTRHSSWASSDNNDTFRELPPNPSVRIVFQCILLVKVFRFHLLFPFFIQPFLQLRHQLLLGSQMKIGSIGRFRRSLALFRSGIPRCRIARSSLVWFFRSGCSVPR